MQELEQKVIDWAEERGIFASSDPKSQMLKCVSEFSEFYEEWENSAFESEDPLVKMEVGDVVVTLILLAKMLGTSVVECMSLENHWEVRDTTIIRFVGILADNVAKGRDCKEHIGNLLFELQSFYELDLEECLALAFEKISGRKGEMVNGVFVREGDK